MITLRGSFETDLDANAGLQTKTRARSWLFRDMELSLVSGGWTCLLGPSGVGKTTVLRLLAGLDTHGGFTGEITSETGQVPACAYMAQQDLLLPWLNVLENVCLGARLRGEVPDHETPKALISKVGLSEHVEKVPAQLSGGMRQRAALARTLMEDRAIVLLDEPFSALDARTRAEMQELAHTTLAGKTVLLVTHDPAEAARIGDRILILDETGLRETKGKTHRSIAAVEAPETLKRHSNLLQELRKETLGAQA